MRLHFPLQHYFKKNITTALLEFICLGLDYGLNKILWFLIFLILHL